MQDRKKLWQQAGSMVGTAAAGTTEQKKQQARKPGAAAGEAVAKATQPSPAVSPISVPATPSGILSKGKSALSKLKNKMPKPKIAGQGY